ncbi:MAG: hypothetical protein JJT88_19600 [Gammaproteobacteria bacterium]|nr:hypothetical protein [Gammaproteobacteria bacterium]
MDYQVLFERPLLGKVETYRHQIILGELRPGARLAKGLAPCEEPPDAIHLLELLVQTKQPQIFAESAVSGDGSDWNAVELSLLGDISIAVDVEVYDDGRHREPVVHPEPFSATLIFTCGALLTNGHGLVAPDLNEISQDGTLNQAALNALYARRLRPVFTYIQDRAKARQRPALVTLPGLGCGQFAGRYRGQMGHRLRLALEQLLSELSPQQPTIQTVIFDPYDEGEDDAVDFGATRFRVRPLLRSSHPKPQLCPPRAYEEAGEDFADCELYSLVAWDQVSWPGNDFYIGSRATDDGVKAAATNVMTAMTGVAGRYDPSVNKYQPPEPYRNWEACVLGKQLALQLGQPFIQG